MHCDAVSIEATDWPQIVTLEIREDVSDHKAITLREQLGERLTIVYFVKERCCGGKEAVENAALRIELCVDVRHAPVLFDLESGAVAVGAADFSKRR